jgi:hypothetical protein
MPSRIRACVHGLRLKGRVALVAGGEGEGASKRSV